MATKCVASPAQCYSIFTTVPRERLSRFLDVFNRIELNTGLKTGKSKDAIVLVLNGSSRIF